MIYFRSIFAACALITLNGCAVQKIAEGGPALTKVTKVPGGKVVTFRTASQVPAPYRVIEEVWVRDDGDTLPKVLERNLREVAGARGANGLILASTNRELNGTRVDLKVRLDDPFKYFAGTAVWIGKSPQPITVIRQ